MVHCCKLFSYYFQTAHKTKQASSEGRTQRSSELSSSAASHSNVEANNLLSGQPRTPTGEKHLRALLSAERQGVAALRSVADMLKKSAENLSNPWPNTGVILMKPARLYRILLRELLICRSCYLPVVF